MLRYSTLPSFVTFRDDGSRQECRDFRKRRRALQGRPRKAKVGLVSRGGAGPARKRGSHSESQCVSRPTGARVPAAAPPWLKRGHVAQPPANPSSATSRALGKNTALARTLWVLYVMPLAWRGDVVSVRAGDAAFFRKTERRTKAEILFQLCRETAEDCSSRPRRKSRLSSDYPLQKRRRKALGQGRCDMTASGQTTTGYYAVRRQLDRCPDGE
ncbi:hypothetical protein MRX96_013673 [Rhipicephalus microplus]